MKVTSIDGIMKPFYNTESLSKSEAIYILSSTLKKIENRPLSYDEKMKFETITDSFKKKYSIDESSNVAQMLLKRLNFSFIPGLSKLDIDPKVLASNDISFSSLQEEFTTNLSLTIPANQQNDISPQNNQEAVEVVSDLDTSLFIPPEPPGPPQSADNNLNNNDNHHQTIVEIPKYISRVPKGRIECCKIYRIKNAFRRVQCYQLLLKSSNKDRSILSHSCTTTTAATGTTDTYKVILQAKKAKSVTALSTRYLILSPLPNPRVPSSSSTTSSDSEGTTVAMITYSSSGSVYEAQLMHDHSHWLRTLGAEGSGPLAISMQQNAIDKSLSVAAVVVTNPSKQFHLSSLLERLVSTRSLLSSTADLLALTSVAGEGRRRSSSFLGSSSTSSTSVGGAAVVMPSRKNVILQDASSVTSGDTAAMNGVREVRTVPSEGSGTQVTAGTEGSEGGKASFQLRKESEDGFALEFSGLSLFQAFAIALVIFDK